MISPEWAFELVSAAQRFICDTWDMDLGTAPDAARRFCGALSEPESLASAVVLRSTLIQICLRWGYACHAAVSARCPTAQCVPTTLAGLGQTWSTIWPDTVRQRPNDRQIFIMWVDAFCLEVTRTHPQRLAQRGRGHPHGKRRAPIARRRHRAAGRCASVLNPSCIST